MQNALQKYITSHEECFKFQNTDNKTFYKYACNNYNIYY